MKWFPSQRFLSKESLGGEIPFFIASYDAVEELEVNASIASLIRKLDTAGVPVLEINLYDLMCEILDEKGGIERMFEVEKKKSKERFLRALQSVPEHTSDSDAANREEDLAVRGQSLFLDGYWIGIPLHNGRTTF